MRSFSIPVAGVAEAIKDGTPYFCKSEAKDDVEDADVKSLEMQWSNELSLCWFSLRATKHPVQTFTLFAPNDSSNKEQTALYIA